MALRGGAAGRGPNPVAGVLRDLEQRTRSNRRTVGSQGRRLAAEIETVELTPGPPGPKGDRGPRGEQGEPGAAPFGAIVSTDSDGRASWTWNVTLDRVPVIGATVVDPNPDDNTTVVVNIDVVTVEAVTVQVWRTRPLLGLGLLPLVPAGAGVEVHLSATPLS